MEPQPTLTNLEAHQFVAKKLNLPNFDQQFKNNRLDALNAVVRTFQAVFPFQNVTLMATPTDQRRVPTCRDIMNVPHSKGSLCTSLNSFLVTLINKLGYAAYTAGAQVVGTDPGSHAVVIVTDVLELGDSYLVDVGSGYPCYQAVSLQGKPHVYVDSFLEWTVIKNGDLYSRHHLKGDDRVFLTGPGVPPDGTKFYDFSLTPQKNSYFQKTQLGIYTDQKNSIFLKNIYMAFYPPGKGITLKMDKFRVFDDQSRTLTENRTLVSVDDYLRALREWDVPMDERELREAVQLYFSCREEDGAVKNGH